MKGSLALFRLYAQSWNCHLWVMEEYGAVESWVVMLETEDGRRLALCDVKTQELNYVRLDNRYAGEITFADSLVSPLRGRSAYWAVKGRAEKARSINNDKNKLGSDIRSPFHAEVYEQVKDIKNEFDNGTELVDRDGLGFTLLNFNHLAHSQNISDELFIFASQAEQVFYVQDAVEEDCVSG
ncbi:hypothetical protein RJ639_042146 [Escallonia herrerae]|uniref:DUF4216 domain-containing protein n=1 Tax=Escallonia herrerae TaxID=1293975 RepID=A0AA88WFU4_9ASTE|nr:hypothetical protein RJ639_042146 [Escallonia herrerae]